MPCGVKRRHAEHDVAHVADARVGDQLLQVLLRHGAERAVDDVAGAERAEEPVSQVRGGGRAAWEVDAQDAVGAHLQQHAGEDHGDRRRRLDVRVGQPGVERERRDLDREADEQRDPDNMLETPPQLVERPDRQHFGAELIALRHHRSHVEGVRLAARSRAPASRAASARCRPACRGRT